MQLRARMDEAIRPFHLLGHPFYKAWSDGTLSRTALRRYARQYYHHVLAFPTYVSAVHSQAGDDRSARATLLENLIEEERGPKNHPILWQQFAAALGETDVAAADPGVAVCVLVDTFRALTQRDLATGAAALYAYESQVPAVAEAKLAGLRQRYDVNDPRALEFFEVHKELDKWHSAQTAEIIERVTEDPEVPVRAAATAARALWSFLDHMAVA